MDPCIISPFESETCQLDCEQYDFKTKLAMVIWKPLGTLKSFDNIRHIIKTGSQGFEYSHSRTRAIYSTQNNLLNDEKDRLKQDTIIWTGLFKKSTLPIINKAEELH